MSQFSRLKLNQLRSILVLKSRRPLIKWGTFWRQGCVSLLLFIACLFKLSYAEDSPLTVAVASNFRFPLERIIASSEYWSQQNIRIVTGSSGVLYAQITKGAPFDVFLSADEHRPQQLVLNGFAESSSAYAIGKLALWPVPKNILHNRMATQAKISQLLAEHKGKFAIAHPKLAPFGARANEYLQQNVGNDKLMEQLVFGNNITQTFQFVDSGNASMGLVAESLLIQAKLQFKQNKYSNYLLPERNSYAPIVQHLLILKRTNSPKKATEFTHFILSEQVQGMLTSLGYFSVLDKHNEHNND